MILEKDNIIRCAGMTKIRLNTEEQQRYEKELKDLFKWVEELAQVDTSSIEENSITHAAYLRPDEPITNAALSQDLVAAFPAQEGHCAKVKKVL